MQSSVLSGVFLVYLGLAAKFFYQPMASWVLPKNLLLGPVGYGSGLAGWLDNLEIMLNSVQLSWNLTELGNTKLTPQGTVALIAMLSRPNQTLKIKIRRSLAFSIRVMLSFFATL